MRKQNEKEEAIKAMDELYLWLGRAISDCTKVEKAVGDVYRSCFPLMTEPLAMHSFYAIRGSSQRLTMTSRAVSCFLFEKDQPKEMLSNWDSLLKRVSAISELRNRLAHGQVTAVKRLGVDTEYKISIVPYSYTEPYRSSAAEHLRPISRAAKGTFVNPPETVSFREVAELTAECHTVEEALRDFGHELRSLQSE